MFRRIEVQDQTNVMLLCWAEAYGGPENDPFYVPPIMEGRVGQGVIDTGFGEMIVDGAMLYAPMFN